MRLHNLKIENVKRFAQGSQAFDVGMNSERDPESASPGWTVIAGPNGAGKTTVLQAIAGALISESALQVVANGELLRWPRAGTTHGEVRLVCSGARLLDLLEPGLVDLGLEDDRWALGFGFALESMGRQVSRHDSAMLPPELLARLEKQSDLRLQTAVQISKVGGMSSQHGPTLQALSALGLGPWAENGPGWFCAGYGTHRRIEGTAASESGRLFRVRSLFSHESNLAGAVEWLQSLELGARTDARAAALRDGAIKLLNDGLLPGKAKIEGVDDKGIRVRMPKMTETLLLQQLGEGYRVVAGLVLDLYRRLAEAQDVEPASDLVSEGRKGKPVILGEGLVLIDEAEQHLHPSWQKELGFWLKERFPNVQFIVTTHSPFICEAADCLIRLSAPGSPGPAAEVLKGPEFWTIVNGEADDIALSTLFGLDGTASTEATRLRASVAEREGRLLRGKMSSDEVEALREDILRLPDPGTAFYRDALKRRRLRGEE